MLQFRTDLKLIGLSWDSALVVLDIKYKYRLTLLTVVQALMVLWCLLSNRLGLNLRGDTLVA